MCNVIVGGRTDDGVESALPRRAHNNTEESFSKRGLFITSVVRSRSGDFGGDRYFAFTLEAVEARQTVVSRQNLAGCLVRMRFYSYRCFWYGRIIERSNVIGLGRDVNVNLYDCIVLCTSRYIHIYISIHFVLGNGLFVIITETCIY